jgi:multiple sugar transport system substrate-binding protein
LDRSHTRRELLKWTFGAAAAGALAACTPTTTAPTPTSAPAKPAGAAPTAPAAAATTAPAKPAGAATTAPTAAAAAPAAAAPKPGATLVFNTFPFGTEKLPPYLETFAQQYGSKAELNAVPSNYHPTTETRFRGGADFDVVAADEGFPNKWRKAGWIVDIDGMPGLDKVQKDMLPSLLEAGKVDGKLVALPGNGLTKVMVYNAEVLDKAGLKPAESWDEFFDQAVKMKQGGHADFPYVPMWTKAFGLTTYFAIGDSYSRGAKEWFDPATLEPRYDSDAAVLETLEFWKRLWDAKLVPPDVLTVDHNATTAIFAAGGRAYFQHNHGQVLPVLNGAPDKYGAVAGKIKLMLYPGTTRECLTGTNWVCLTTRGAQNGAWSLTQFLGATDKNGEYLVPTKWRALDIGAEVAYKPVLDDPEVKAKWDTFTDSKILAEQKERARLMGAVTQAPWFSEWLERSTAEFQSAIIGDTSPKDAIKTSADFARENNKA